MVLLRCGIGIETKTKFLEKKMFPGKKKIKKSGFFIKINKLKNPKLEVIIKIKEPHNATNDQ